MTRLLVAAAFLLVPSLAAADRVTVKGAVLEGKVKSVSSKKIVMKTIYGKGDLTIATADVTAIETDAPFHVYRADDGVNVGSLVGITPAAVTVAQADGATAEIPFDQVQAAPRDAGSDANWFERRGVESPWWTSNYDFALSATESTIDSTAVALGIGATRERGPTRLKLGASYLRSTTQNDHSRDDDIFTPEDESESGSEHITLDELRGFARLEHDLTERVFGFGSLEAEHDGVESLSYRLIPKFGAGYKFVNTDDAYLAVDAGFAYVYGEVLRRQPQQLHRDRVRGGAQVEAALVQDRLVLARRLPAFDHGSDGRLSAPRRDRPARPPIGAALLQGIGDRRLQRAAGRGHLRQLSHHPTRPVAHILSRQPFARRLLDSGASLPASVDNDAASDGQDADGGSPRSSGQAGHAGSSLPDAEAATAPVVDAAPRRHGGELAAHARVLPRAAVVTIPYTLFKEQVQAGNVGRSPARGTRSRAPSRRR